jgi:sugar phosphate isomerase/epimerase
MGEPRFSVSECTTFPRSFAEDVAAYRTAGVDGIGIWEFKLEPGRDAEHAALLADSGLRASICVPDVPSIVPDGYFTTPSDPGERTRALCDAMCRLARFEPEVILAVTGDPTGRDLAEMRRVTVHGLREAATVAADLGLTIGVEAYRATSGAMINTLPDSVALVDEVGAPNVGVIVDLWHLWDQPGIVDQLRTYAPRIVGVQVGDWREPTRSWADRVLPGDGVADLPAMLGAVDAGGYRGWYDLEIFSDDGRFGNTYPDSIAAQDPVDVARRGLAGFRRAWDLRPRATA